jgi:hypothetical protein
MDNSASYQSKPVNLMGFDLEEHVEQSFRTAWALTEGRPINARHALLAAIIVSRTMTSTAFSKLASLLPIMDLDKPPVEQTSRVELEALSLDSALAAAYSLAESFLQNGTQSGRGEVWGRDYITVALLAVDPSLKKLAEEAGSSLATLRDQWFEFVTKDGRRRDPESWKEWWYYVNVPLPDDRAQPFTDNVYLLTWNPTRTLIDNFVEVVRRVKEEGTAIAGWSVGGHGAKAGDRVFFMRHGEDRPGLVGSGQIVSDAREDRHWDKNTPEHYTAFSAKVLWDTLGELPLVPLKELVEITGEEKLWTTEGSGLPVPREVVERLEPIWEEVRTRRKQSTPPVPSIAEMVRPLAWVERDAIPVIGDLSEYRPSKHDSLDAKAQAEIFATLLVAKEVEPPFALGLLGDWGVGKTFFMRLMQETVASIAGKGVRAERSSDSVSRATQIEFNAWHYVDSDLWASLASHIFDGLSEELRGPNDKVEDIRRRLRRTIRSSRQEQEEATAAIDAAQKERQTAAKELGNKQAERARIAANCESHRLKRVWQAVLEVKPNPDDPAQRNWPNVAELRVKAERIAKRLGITTAIDSAEEVQRVYYVIRELSRRGGALATAFAATFTGNRTWISVVVLAVLLALVVVWPWMLAHIETFLNISEGTFARLLAPFLQLATIVGAVAVWVTKNLKLTSSAMSYLEVIRDELHEPRLKLPEATVEEKKLKDQIEEFDAEIAKEQRRIEEADRQISEAQAEIQRINAGGLVYDFLEGRVRDSRYLDRLGLISVIRQDFAELGTLLRDWRKHGASDDGKGTSPSDGSWDTRPIERLLLYIDDLDRCPPKRVVEVLQAVHLILAFDLFAVVVAVDARWLERSLNEAYNLWTVPPDGSPPEEPVHRFSAHNYLEKIFQIPFSLPLMDETGYRKLVGDMIVPPRTRAERAEAERLSKEQGRTEATKQDDSRQGATPTTREKEVPPAAAEGKTEHMQQETEEQHRKQEEERRRIEREKREQEEKERQKREQEEARKRIEAMLLRECEEQFIKALFCFINTPRLAKRFVNIYRLLRVRAATLQEDFSTFIDRERGEYRAALMLLAISVGRADVAPEILDDLYKAEGSSFCTWIEATSRRYEEKRAGLNEERIARNERTEATVIPSGRESRLAELRDASHEIREGIDAVREALNELKGPSFDDRLATYSKWASEVGRYSFRWHLRADA